MKFNNKTLIYIWFAYVMLSMLPLIFLSYYGYPCADDFMYTRTTRMVWLDDGSIITVLREAINVSIKMWNGWQGLYSSAFILALSPSIFGIEYYYIGAAFLILFLNFSLFLFIRTVIYSFFENNTYLSLMIFSNVAFLSFHSIPDCCEAFYWFNGAYNYMFFLCLLLVELSMAIKLTTNNTSRLRQLYLCSIIVIAIIISGGNHVIAFANLLLLLGMCLLFIINKNLRNLWLVLSIFIFATIGFVFNVTSPGTAARQGFFGEADSPINVIYRALTLNIDYIRDWMGFPFYLSAFLVLLLSLILLKNKKIKYKLINPLIVAILIYLFISSTLAMPLYAIKSGGEGRIADIRYIMYIICAMLYIPYCILWFNGNQYLTSLNKIYKNSSDRVLIYISIIIMVILFILGFRYKYHGYEAARLIVSNEAQTYKNECSDIENIILSSPDLEIKLPPITFHPDILEYIPISEDKDYWINKMLAGYYGKDAIYIDTSISR